MIGRGLDARWFMGMKILGGLAFVALTLAACGGGGGGSGVAPPPAVLSDTELAEVRSDERVVRLGEILGRADALLLTSARARYSLEGGGETLAEDLVDAFSCTGARCEAADGTAISVTDLTGSAADLGVRLSEAALATRGGFDATTTRGRLDITDESEEGVRVIAAPTVESYGFWGAHGYAALELGEGPLTGEVEGTAVSGRFAFARAYAAGAASGSNPAGTGSATWSGIVEASPAGAFARLQGTVTVTIADLSRPRVGVSVSVPGHSVGAPGWADMPLLMGRFSTGTMGSDYLEGDFHGPGHEEAWGVFDTQEYLGAFGAKRAP
ncbi:MAG: hypothetical protein OXG62_09275 [Nitrospinae bacterium]|nr:hypothetical protein [Nitrospinota bacterium]